MSPSLKLPVTTFHCVSCFQSALLCLPSLPCTVTADDCYPVLALLCDFLCLLSLLSCLCHSSYSLLLLDTFWTGTSAVCRISIKLSITVKNSLFSSVAEHWSCKPGVESSILSGGKILISNLLNELEKQVLALD